MAKTNTLLVNGQAVGGSAAVASNILKTTLQAGTTVASISAKLTNGAAQGNNQKRVKVWFAISPFSITDTDAPAQFGAVAQCLEVLPHRDAGGIQYCKTDLQPADGLYIYSWTEVPLLDAAATLTVNLLEM